MEKGNDGLEGDFELAAHLCKQGELVVVADVPPLLAEGASARDDNPRALSPDSAAVFAVIIERGGVQLLSKRVHKVVHFALRHGRDYKQARARVEPRLSPDQGQPRVEVRVVEEFARAQEDDGEFDPAFEGGPFPVNDLGHELGVLGTFVVFSRERVDRCTDSGRELVQAQDEDKHGRDEFAVFADPDWGDQPVRIKR